MDRFSIALLNHVHRTSANSTTGVHAEQRRLGVREGIEQYPPRSGIAHLRVCRHSEAGGIVNGCLSAQKARHLTYCVGVMLDRGMIFASDSRTNTGVDNFAKFCKIYGIRARRRPRYRFAEFGKPGRTQAVISVLTQRCADGDAATNLLGARTMFDTVRLVARRDA
jgi:hypothetical protein